jgi:hypothetical protein
MPSDSRIGFGLVWAKLGGVLADTPRAAMTDNGVMQLQKYEELENRASATGVLDEIRKLEARARVHREIEAMKEEGKALVLSEEEEGMLHSFRRFKLRMRKHGEVFTWQTRMPEGVQIAEETANILSPQEL